MINQAFKIEIYLKTIKHKLKNNKNEIKSEEKFEHLFELKLKKNEIYLKNIKHKLKQKNENRNVKKSLNALKIFK